MTVGQKARLEEIHRDLERAKHHPSQAVRDSVKFFTRDEIKKCQIFINEVIIDDDGFQAYRIIEIWHRESEAGVLRYILEIIETEENML